MTITAKITAEGLGERWTAEFPRIDTEKCFSMLDGKMTADADECYLALAKSPRIQGVRHDEKYLNQLVAAWVRYVNSWKDENCIGEDSDGYAHTMKRIERRNEREMVTFVKAVWYEHKGVDVSLSIRLGNDGSVVQKREYERFFAWKMVEAAALVNEDLAERGLPTITMDEGTLALLDEFRAWCRARDAERELKRKNEERFLCPHYRNGFCTTDCEGKAPDFGCACYCGGRCVEATAIKAKDDKEVK